MQDRDPIFYAHPILLNLVLAKWPMRDEILTPHGPSHWMRVAENADVLMRRELPEAQWSTVRPLLGLFALIHDSRRQHDGEDATHGPDAADFLRGLPKELLPYSDSGLMVIALACEQHTRRCPSGYDDYDDEHPKNAKIMHICFDADRLDLGRDGVGITPDPDRLFTATAKMLAGGSVKS